MSHRIGPLKRVLTGMKAFAEHPATQVTTGAILLISGGAEIVYDFMDAERSLRIGGHHGVALFGLIQLLGSVPNLVDGIERSFTSVDDRDEENRP